jgi:hypothetical protein
MTTAIQHTNGAGISAATMEAVVVGGDLAKLTPPQRLEWYRNRCEAAGLDPRTQPFQYITLQGKLTLYATKAATDQLIASRSLSVQIVNRGMVGDLYEVVVRVTFPDGHHVEDMAALPISGLRGDALANATMKCVTKAKRRTVLSACGLGMMDESEAETIPGAVVVAPEVLPPPITRQLADTDAKKDELTRVNAHFWASVREAAQGQAIPAGDVDAVVHHVLASAYQLKSITELTAPKLKAFGRRLSEPGVFAEKWSEWCAAQEIPSFDDVTQGEIDGDNMAAQAD